ncbi:MAG: hypothetical protein ABIG32_02290 [Candidatus Uhrbacteria bacterium]|nr:hypothetical protein [Patescibacteria group bacterium]MBU1907005.1 hypothetical protein [Patescibacteria group bacterium]
MTSNGFEAKFRDALTRSEFEYDTSGQGTEIVALCFKERMWYLSLSSNSWQDDAKIDDVLPEVINIALFFGHFIDKLSVDDLYRTFCARFLDEGEE